MTQGQKGYRLADLLWQDATHAATAQEFHSIVIISNGRETIGVEVDIRDRDRIEQMVAQTVDTFGKVLFQDVALAVIFAIVALVLLLKPPGRLGRIRVVR